MSLVKRRIKDANDEKNLNYNSEWTNGINSVLQYKSYIYYSTLNYINSTLKTPEHIFTLYNPLNDTIEMGFYKQSTNYIKYYTDINEIKKDPWHKRRRTNSSMF